MTDNDTDGSDDENDGYPPVEERVRQMREPLDFSPSSGAIGSERKNYDYMSGPDYTAGDHHTTWSDSDTTNEQIERVNQSKNKWDWFKRLNKGEHHTNRQMDNRTRGRHNDFRMLFDEIHGLDQITESQFYSLCVDFADTVAVERDEGLIFGGNRPIEATELAIMSYQARKLIDVDTFDEISMDNDLHNIGFDGDLLAELCSKWTPAQSDITVETIRDLRAELRKFVNDSE